MTAPGPIAAAVLDMLESLPPADRAEILCQQIALTEAAGDIGSADAMPVHLDPVTSGPVIIPSEDGKYSFVRPGAAAALGGRKKRDAAFRCKAELEP